MKLLTGTNYTMSKLKITSAHKCLRYESENSKTKMKVIVSSCTVRTMTWIYLDDILSLLDDGIKLGLRK